MTVEGTLTIEGDALLLSLPESPQPLRLAVLQNKLQWNFKKRRPRGAEEEELRAYEELVAIAGKPPSKPLIVQVTGPLRNSNGTLVLEVREFSMIAPENLSSCGSRYGTVVTASTYWNGYWS